MHFAAIPTAPTMSADTSSTHVSRRSRLGAVALDLGLYAGIQVVAGALALLVWMLQTRGGEQDLGASAATAGWALILAAVPAWFGLLGHSLAVLGTTPGQRAAGLALDGTPGRRLARLFAHPLNALGWLWLATVAALAMIPGVPLLLAAGAIITLGAGFASAVMFLRDPNAPALHDRFAGTRLVVR